VPSCSRPSPSGLSRSGQFLTPHRRPPQIVSPGRLEGTSLGGFVAATAGAIDGRYSSVFIVLAGGDIAGVIANGTRDAQVLRERLTAAGMTQVEIRDTVTAVEPLRLAHRLDPARTWLYSAAHDDVVPPRHARLLAEAVGLAATHHVELHANHSTGILYLPLVLTQIRNHIVGVVTAYVDDRGRSRRPPGHSAGRPQGVAPRTCIGRL